MNVLILSLFGAALLAWSVALARELWALLDHRACERRLRCAGLPRWLRARHWWLGQAGLLAVLATAAARCAAWRDWVPMAALSLSMAMIWCAPPLWLRWRTRRRRATLRRQLPGTLARLCLAAQCLAPFEEALHLALRWGPGGPLDELMQDQLLSAHGARWPRPRVDQPVTPLVSELLAAAFDARAGLIGRDEQLRRWQWLQVRAHPAARLARDPRPTRTPGGT